MIRYKKDEETEDYPPPFRASKNKKNKKQKQKSDFSDLKFLRKEQTKENYFSFRLLRRRKNYRKIFLIKEKARKIFYKFLE